MTQLRKLFTTLMVCVFSIISVSTINAQDGVSIGLTTPHPNATLHIQPPANNGGLLIPRLTTNQRNSIIISNAPDSAEGLMVYDTDINSFYFYDGHWQRLGTPQGGIIMWSGVSPPQGWVLCDGRRYNANGVVVVNGGVLTPDLRGRFIVGYHNGVNGYNQPGNRSTGGTTAGKTGGLETVTLNTNQIPSHTHGRGSLSTVSGGSHRHSTMINKLGLDHKGSATELGQGQNQQNGEVFYSSYEGTHSHNISGSTASTGSGSSHENRPPYYVIAFIMKL